MSTLALLFIERKAHNPSFSFDNKSSFLDNVSSALSSWSYLPGWVSLPCSSLDKYKKIIVYTYNYEIISQQQLAVTLQHNCISNMPVRVSRSENWWILIVLCHSLESQLMVLGYAVIYKIIKNCLKWYPYGELFMYCFKHFLNNVAEKTD